MEVTLQEVHSYMATPEAQGLTFEQCADRVRSQKARLAVVPEFDPAAHLERLRLEREEWKASSGHSVQRVDKALAELDIEIEKYA